MIQRIICFILLALLHSCQQSRNDSSNYFSIKEGVIEIHNGSIKARFTQEDNFIKQEYFSIKDDRWNLVVESYKAPNPFPDNGVQLFNSKINSGYRFLMPENLSRMELVNTNDSSSTVILSGTRDGTTFEQHITLDNDRDYFHFEVAAQLAGQPAKLDYLLSAFTFNLDQPPSFVHTPGIKYDNQDSGQDRFELLPGSDHIIGDRAFHAPAVILQEGSLFAALVPDLNAINKYAVVSPDARRHTSIPRNKFSVPFEDDKYTMPTGLDLNVQSGTTDKPILTYGLMDNIIAHHIHYQRVNDSSMIRTLNQSHVKYAFDLFVDADVKEHVGFQRIAQHQWEHFGRPVFNKRPHLAFPFEEYLRIIDSITFNPIPFAEIDEPLEEYKDMGSWLQWELDGTPVGGYRSAIPWWNDVLHNSVFWNNAREAPGFWFWGQQLKRPELINRARRIINLCLAAPQNEQGLFALLYNAKTKTWGLQFSDPPHGRNEFFLRDSDSYNIVGMSKTGAHLLDYYLRCEQDSRILEYLIPYGEWLLTVIDNRGALPSYVTRDMVQSPILYYSAHPATSMWFLAELYNATKEEKFLKGAERIGSYMVKEILPEARWLDLEQYFSCGKKPLNFVRDKWQHQIARGNLSPMWAAEGFAALYRANPNQEFLAAGAQCIDYLSFTQCCWEPHFIYTAFPFGGFGVDNSDNATLLDARQAEAVKPFTWYGKVLGRQDLLERGIAAARSSVVLINLPAHKSNNIYRHTNIYPYGLGPENIDHEAHPQSAMRTHPSWGEGSGVFTGLAEAGRALGGAYIDFEKDLKVGVDGLRVDGVDLKDGHIYLKITSMLAMLEQPWDKNYTTELRLEGLDEGSYKINLNGKKEEDILVGSGQRHWINVEPDGSLEMVTTEGL